MIPPAASYALTVEKIVAENADVRTFRLRLPNGADFSFQPGQFMMFSFPGASAPTRAYTIASSPLDRGYIEITLNRVARFTEHMFALEPGDVLNAKGPYGKWFYTDDVRHGVLISGGTGITPFRSIARYVLQKGLPNRITILYSTKTLADMIYREDWAALEGRSNFKIVHTVTRPHLMEDRAAWTGPTGRISLEMIRREVPDFHEAHYFLCGPNQLVETASKELGAAGVAKERVRYEKWGEF